MQVTQAHPKGKRGRPQGLSSRWAYILDIAVPTILKEYGDLPLTVRQIFYRLVGKYSLKKTENHYNYLDRLLVEHRKNEWIDWDRIVDLTRKPTNLEYHAEFTPQEWIEYWTNEFIDSLSGYHQPEYKNQEYLVEVWSEHEGLQPLFEKALVHYPITLYFTRGRNSWSNFYRSAERLKRSTRKKVILHFYVHVEMVESVSNVRSHVFSINVGVGEV